VLLMPGGTVGLRMARHASDEPGADLTTPFAVVGDRLGALAGRHGAPSDRHRAPVGRLPAPGDSHDDSAEMEDA
jgi:hypothetical protein